jgi:hypothetical protein
LISPFKLLVFDKEKRNIQRNMGGDERIIDKKGSFG